MDIFSQFPSKFLKSSDLMGREVKVVMDRVEVEDIGSDRRPVVYFKGKDKGLVINKTNANTIADMWGPNTKNWIGKEITIYSTRVDFKGERVDAIRVQFVQRITPKPAQQQPQYDERNPPPRTTAEEMSDDIPF